MDGHGQLTQVEVSPGAAARAGQCVLCGEAASQRLDAVVAPFVTVDRPTLPYCEPHARETSAHWVRVTILLVAARLAPLVAGYAAGRTLDSPAWVPAALALGAAVVCFPVERQLVYRWRPRARIVAATSTSWTLAIEGDPPQHFSPGGPAARGGRALLDRTPLRPVIPAMVALLGAFIGHYQWHQVRPTLYLDNPSRTEARVEFADRTVSLAAGAWAAETLRAGSHRVVLHTEQSSLEWTLTLQPGVDMLLASSPYCYEIDRGASQPLSARGQLFSLQTGGWQRVTCPGD